MIAELILTLCSFFQENKSYGVKKPFGLILCLPAIVHHVVNKKAPPIIVNLHKRLFWTLEGLV
jgi:hypothetical protein